MRKLFQTVLLLVPFVAFLRPAQAQIPRYKHDHLNIFPVASVAARQKIAIDGGLSDWKPGAFVEMYADPDLKDIFSLRFAMAYDAQGLIFAAKYTDDSPLINHIDPTTDPFKGWSGDALQLRFVADSTLSQPLPDNFNNSDKIAHLTAWYYTDKNLPALDVRYGMDFHDAHTLTGAASGLAYRREPAGYSVEGRIPWTVFKGVAPKVGERWLMTMQPLWGDADGRYKHSFFDVVSAAGFQFQRPDGWGYGYFVKPAEVAARFTQQAKDDKQILATPDSTPAAATVAVHYNNPKKGFVSLAICKADGEIVRTLLTKAERPAGAQTEKWDGRDDDGNPVPPGKYIVKALVHDGIKPRFVCSVMNSGNPSWGNKGGRYGWGADHGVPDWATTDPDGNAYLMWTFNEGGNYLIKVDQTGQKLWGVDGRGDGVVYSDGLVYVSNADYASGSRTMLTDTIKVYDAATGKYLKSANFGEWPEALGTDAASKLPKWERYRLGDFGPLDESDSMQGITAAPDRLYVAMYLQNKVVALDKATLKEVASFDVPRPIGLAYSPTRKLLYAVSGNQIVSIDPNDGHVAPLVDGLETPMGLALDHAGNLWVSCRGKQMRVLGYSPNGKLLRTVGVAGGRPWMGKFDPQGMLMPGGIAIDAQDRLWVPEQDAMPKRYSLWNLQTGKLIRDFYGSAAYAPMMAPDPEHPESVYMNNTRFIVDYDKGTWEPESTVFRRDVGGRTIPGSEMHPGFMGNSFQIARYNGHTYAYNGRGGIFAVGGDTFKPLEYMGNGFAGLATAPEGLKLEWLPYQWIDGNGDGFIQDSEVKRLADKNLPYETFENIYGFGGHLFPGASFIKGFKFYRPQGLNANGIPIYPELDKGEPILQGDGPMKPYFQNRWDIWPVLGTDWKEFYEISAGKDGRVGIWRFDRQGNIRWRYARVAGGFALNAPLSKTGDLYGALRITGEIDTTGAGNVVGIGCYRGYFGFLNEDGLFIDQVGYDNGRGPSPSFDTFFIENFSGYLFKHPRTGKVYLFCGDVDGRILELQGWNTIQRFAGSPLSVTEADYRRVVAASAGASGATGPKVLSAATGGVHDWDKTKLAKIHLDETHDATVGLRYDAQNLYAYFDVSDSSPWQNTTTDWRYLFKGGDAVDIQLGAKVNSEEKRALQTGDVRVMIAPSTDGKGILAVGMWPKVPAGLDKAPLLYTSPTGQEPFERVAQLEHVTASVEKRPDGYRLIATIPWQDLHIAPPAAFTSMQGDLGVLLSDASGTRVALRRYLFNQDTGITNDVPNEVRINAANWGVISFE
jgi:sugar lactone lactonase YvrE